MAMSGADRALHILVCVFARMATLPDERSSAATGRPSVYSTGATHFALSHLFIRGTLHAGSGVFDL
eukprot:332154-Pelagomonas_calceolata.AAC.2